MNRLHAMWLPHLLMADGHCHAAPCSEATDRKSIKERLVEMTKAARAAAAAQKA
jgi:hypothetical protein